MPDVIWRNEALDQLDAVIIYIRQFDPAAAERVARRLRVLGDSLTQFPNRGRPAANGTRELASVSPYVLTYDVADDVVTILDVRHGAMLPRTF